MLSGSLFASAEDAIYEAEHSVYCGAIWKVAFYKTGFVHEDLSNNCGETSNTYSKLHPLSEKQLQELQKTIDEMKFNELPKSIEPTTFIGDEDVFIIKIHQSKGTKIVSAFGLDRASNRDHARRFIEVWKAMNTIVKEPAYEQNK